MTDSDLALGRSVLSLIVITVNGDEYLLGRPDLQLYLAVPAPGATFVRALQDGASLTEATRQASELAGEEVDGADFIAGLVGVGFLAEPPEAVARRHDASPGDVGSAPPGMLDRVLRPERVRWLFGRTAWTGYGIAAGTAAALLIARVDLRPTFESAWFLTDPMLSLLVMLPIGIAVTAIHEIWHWLAARAIGVPARFRVSHRGVYLVFETDLAQIVTMPRRLRYGPFLAGMAFDVTVLAAALIGRLAFREGVLQLPVTLDRLLGAIILIQVTTLVWQCAAVFLRSDVYAVLANALGCHNLYRATWLTNRWRLFGLTAAQQHEYLAISAHDRLVARWFGLIQLAGLIVMAWMTLHFGIPFLVVMGTWVATVLKNWSVGTVAFWESLAVVLYLACMVGGPPLLGWRERRLRRAGVLR